MVKNIQINLYNKGIPLKTEKVFRIKGYRIQRLFEQVKITKDYIISEWIMGVDRGAERSWDFSRYNGLKVQCGDFGYGCGEGRWLGCGEDLCG